MEDRDAASEKSYIPTRNFFRESFWPGESFLLGKSGVKAARLFKVQVNEKSSCGGKGTQVLSELQSES